MQLRTARLCLDCEEVHEAQECPVCLSEAFVYMTRWMPAEKRRRTRRFPSATNVYLRSLALRAGCNVVSLDWR